MLIKLKISKNEEYSAGYQLCKLTQESRKIDQRKEDILRLLETN